MIDPFGASDDWTATKPLAEGQYLMLGDNPPVSLDSRRWNGLGFSGESLLGRVVRFPFEAR
jgi:hypothetical protein